jgi:hypothetical protein
MTSYRDMTDSERALVVNALHLFAMHCVDLASKHAPRSTVFTAMCAQADHARELALRVERAASVTVETAKGR